MQYDSLVETAWKFHNMALTTGEILGWIALLGGIIGYLMTTTRPTYQRRFLGLFIGGCVTLIMVLFVEYIYRAVAFILIDNSGANIGYEGNVYPTYVLTHFNEVSEFIVFAQVFSRIASIIGAAAVVFGTSLWGISKKRSLYRGKSRRIVATGIALMVATTLERIGAAALYILA